MPTDQYVEMKWETPSHDEITQISRNHVAVLETSDDDAVWIVAGMHHVLLTTVGRKSGQRHKVALPFWRDPDGTRIVVGSFAGAPKHPAWYLNLSDRTANPEIHVRVQGGEYWSVPEEVGDDEYEQIWKLLTEDRAWYDNYRAKTDRRIPLIRLPETRSV